MQFASVSGEDNTIWLPAFTDWIEFEKLYDKNIWSGNIVTYDDLIALSEKMKGIVINCKGIALRIDEKNKKMIDEYKKKKENPKSASISEHTVEKDTKVTIGATDAELKAIIDKRLKVRELFERLGSEYTDYKRESLF